MRALLYPVVVVTVLALVPSAEALFLDDNLPEHDLYKPGDIIIAGFFPRSQYSNGYICGPKKSQISMQGSMGMRFALDRITANSSLLPNITLGYVLFDDCNKEVIALSKTAQLIPVNTCVKTGCGPGPDKNVLTVGPNPQYNVVGVVGPFGSTLQLRTSLLMSYFEIPHISWIATSDDLSDKTRYKYFSRVVPPDRFQARALVDILNHYNWTYISTLYSEGSYGTNGIRILRKGIRELGFCIAYSSELRFDFSESDFDQIVANLRKYPKARVVVMYVEAAHGLNIMRALERANAEVEFTLLSREGLSENAVTAIKHAKKNWQGLAIASGSDQQFDDYYMTQSPFGTNDTLWTGEYDKTELECSWDVPTSNNKSCSHFKTYHDIPGYYLTQWPARIIDATNTYGFALHALISERCPNAFTDKSILNTCINGPLLLKYIHQVKFKGSSTNIEYDEKGDLIGGSYVILSHSWDLKSKDVIIEAGTWYIKTRRVDIDENKMIWWTKDQDGSFIRTTKIPESVCAKACDRGEFYLKGEQTCCWECRKCRDNEYLRTDLSGCDVCPLNTWPDQVNFTTCELIPLSYMLWTDPISIGLAAFSGILIFLTLIILIIFIHNRHKKVIKGSSRELMAPIIIGLLLAYSTVFFFIAKAEQWLCYANYFGFNLSCTLIFGPLFLKMLRMYRLFAAAEKCQVSLRGMGSTTQVVAALMIFLAQVVVTVVMCIYQPPQIEEWMPVLTTKHVELSCLLPHENLLAPLSLNLLLLILCAVFGFLTRKLPENFNESWHIFITVTTTLFLWIAFLPTYFVAFYAYHKSALLGLALILNGMVTMLCLLAPKVYALYFVGEHCIKVSNFDFPDSRRSATTETSVSC